MPLPFPCPNSHLHLILCSCVQTSEWDLSLSLLSCFSCLVMRMVHKRTRLLSRTSTLADVTAGYIWMSASRLLSSHLVVSVSCQKPFPSLALFSFTLRLCPCFFSLAPWFSPLISFFPRLSTLLISLSWSLSLCLPPLSLSLVTLPHLSPLGFAVQVISHRGMFSPAQQLLPKTQFLPT